MTLQTIERFVSHTYHLFDRFADARDPLYRAAALTREERQGLDITRVVLRGASVV